MIFFKTTVLIIVFLFIKVAFADSADRALIAASLFDIPSGSINDITDGAYYNYNVWQANPNNTNTCNGYLGGHSGLDIQTKDVAGVATADRIFFAVSKGVVISAGEDAYNTIAVYDSAQAVTVLYLHARTIEVAVDDNIDVGDLLGIQGSTGAGTAEHVHLEVRAGLRTGPACGATTTIDPESNILHYLKRVDVTQSVLSLLLNKNSSSGPQTVTSAGQVWMDRNLGASRVATSPTDTEAYGDLYQWGRLADGHESRTSPTISTNSTADVPGHGSFILESSSPIDWRIPQNDSLWQGVSGTNNPCPSGFRLPTATELDIERTSWSSNDSAGAFGSPLKLVMAGNRIFLNGALFNAGSTGYYWSSTVSGSGSGSSNSYLNVTTSDAYMPSNFRAYGYSVRCIQD